MAVVGASCRLPGSVTGLQELWEALCDSRVLVGEVPADRFDASRFVDKQRRKATKSYTSAGGFLNDVAGFDSGYFTRISPREAARMDPQHRLLLEMAIEALDDAGIDHAASTGSDTAVLIGMSSHDYADLQTCGGNPPDAHTMAGLAATNAANRISHLLDWNGPSMTVDTACSSALTAVHQACEVLRTGQARTALAGGVSVLLSPFAFTGFSSASMLSPTGLCRPFSADADGYVRAEGGGMVALKRLSDALADGDRVHAVILASGVNSDGRTTGLALPSARSQAALLEQVYARAQVSPDEVSYLEAHGTGTPVGDPIECEAIGRALGERRTRSALPIGSVKSNTGHLEAASGMAGLLKALLVLKHRCIPPTLHASPLNPRIDFDGWNLLPCTQETPLDVDRPVVGVNCFGFGGANAHAVLTVPPRTAVTEQAPEPPRHGPLPVVVSARTPQALKAAAIGMARRLEGETAQGFYDAAWTAARRRTAHDHRAVVLASGPGQAVPALAAVGEDTQPLPGGCAEAQAVRDGRVVFAFSGNGCQWAGMGADLLREDPVFCAAVARADDALAPHLGWSVREEMEAADPERVHATEIAQPLLFAFQTALVESLAARGIRPAAVMGHSIGEIAAALTAGALDLDTAARVVAARSHAQAATRGRGRMAAIGLPLDDAVKELAPYGGGLELAAVNGAEDVTVSGPEHDLLALGDALETQGVFFRLLDLDYAFHSRAMDPVHDDLMRALGRLRPRAASIPFVSTVTGVVCPGEDLDAGYWWRNVREPVLFGPALQALLHEGHDTFVEIGSHPVLKPYLRKALQTEQLPGLAVPTCARTTSGRAAVDTAAAHLLAAGARVHWETFFSHPGRTVDLPSYPWQREPHWHGDPQWWLRVTGETGPVQHPLLGAPVPVQQPTWSTLVEPARLPWLSDHQVSGAVVMPATAYLEMALAAGHLVHGTTVEVNHLLITRALDLPWHDDERDVHLQVSVNPADRSVDIAARTDDKVPWQPYARARVQRLLRGEPTALDLASLRARVSTPLDATEHYDRARRSGLLYGPAFQVLTELHTAPGEALAAYTLGEASDGYHVHPALLDGALQAGAAMTFANRAYLPYLPVAVEALRVWHTPPADGLVHVRSQGGNEQELCWDITLTDTEGRVCLELTGCRLRRTNNNPTEPVQHLVGVLRAAPRPGDHDRAAVPGRDRLAPLPAPTELAAACRPEHDRLEKTWRRERNDEAVRHLRECCAHLIADALGRLLPDVRTFDTDDLIAGGMLPGYTRLAALLADTARGTVHRLEGPGAGRLGRWRLPEHTQSQELFARVLRDFPQQAVAISLFGRCCLHLSEVLRGTRDPLELLFDEPDRHLIEYFYSDSAQPRYHNGLVRALVREQVRAWPSDRPLRVLEVGAGTGSTTAVLLPELPAERTAYTFTDLSAGFFPAARSRFAGYDFVDYRCLDLDADPAEQGFSDSSYDVVIATNVLHATSDLRQSLGRIGRLLSDGGQLLVFETHDPAELAPVFGPLAGFWNFTDTDLRSTSPLLPADAWEPLLHTCGFDEVAQLGHDRPAAELAYSVLCARRGPRDEDPTRRNTVPATTGETSWIVAAESRDSVRATALTAALTRLGASARLTTVEEAPHAWIDTTGQQPSRLAVIFDAEAPTNDPAAMTEQAVQRLAVLRTLAESWAAPASGTQADLWIITRPSGLHPAPEHPTAPQDAALWGAARSLANEHPHITVRRVSHAAEAGAERLAMELLHPDAEDEVVLTRGGRFVPRVVPARPATAPAGPNTPYTLRLDEPGLHPRPIWSFDRPRRPADDEVTIDVRAAALNYRDVMLAAGLLPPGAEVALPEGPAAGLECAGTITAVGAEVTHLAPGDRVYALAPRSLSSQVSAPARLVGRMPDGMSFTAAATLPVVYFTVHHALERLARLQPGETVLIHGAAGGVGLAAIQLCHTRGATVIATAGTPAKRDLLRMLGVQHVFDSRTLGFAEHVRDLTAGEGVDVVLNSLAGEAIARSLELLRPGGRFLELGKRDIYASTPLAMRPFANNVAFFGIDAHQLITHRLPQAGACFDEVAQRISDGTYRPLPHLTYPSPRVGEALRALQRSRHIGKVVITFDESPAVEQPPPSLELSPDRTYLITGGLSGLGAAMAHRLASRGARHLALLGRRGPNTPGAAKLVQALAARGATATAHAADITNEADLRRVLEAIDTGSHPLGGVIHAAMRLDDAPLVELGDDRLRTAVEPKMLGAALLDALTRDRDPHLFAMCSSATAWFGNAYQANYAAANSYLEALARARHHAGKAGSAVAWGAIGGTGYAARHQITDVMERLGLDALTPDEACAALEDAVARGTDVTAAAKIDWGRIRSMMPAVRGPRLAGLIPAHTATDDGPDRLRRRLATATPEEALKIAADAITQVLADILQTDADRLERDRRLDQLGLDSLMAVEAVVATRRRLGCELPTLEILNAQGITDLARRALIRLGHETSTTPPTTAESTLRSHDATTGTTPCSS
ncbi:SDR family NAD(P)-dependent oxidoreductase [Streptomyces sp. NPDC058818]|uniref:SDR family NAD(P)-dependent oxidoreductase n=1 Tax=Streptomyces sp. NPDC058818 TaxID=3346640 RepID=UPI0036746064